MEAEKRCWIRILRLGSLTRESQVELADVLEGSWFPRPVGRPSRLDWSDWEIDIYNAQACSIELELDRLVEEMKERNERPYGGRRAAAKGILAEHWGLSIRGLEQRMKRIPNPRKKTG